MCDEEILQADTKLDIIFAIKWKTNDEAVESSREVCKLCAEFVQKYKRPKFDGNVVDGEIETEKIDKKKKGVKNDKLDSIK